MLWTVNSFGVTFTDALMKIIAPVQYAPVATTDNISGIPDIEIAN
jgi:hypothetical protein